MIDYLINEEIVGKEFEKVVREYKYSGTDHSILYVNLYSPLAEYIVQKATPRWLALA